MPHYLYQGRYTPWAMKNLMMAPEDRAAAVTGTFEAAGGRLVAFYFALGEHDFFAVAELPDNLVAATVAIAVESSGRVTGCRVVPLFTSAEGMAAMRAAREISYSPPGAASSAAAAVAAL